MNLRDFAWQQNRTARWALRAAAWVGCALKSVDDVRQGPGHKR